MVTNKSRLLRPKLFWALEPIAPNYDTDCLNCARKGEYSSMWNIVALAYLLKVKVEVIYPAVNGSDNYSFINNKRTTSFTQIRTSVRGFSDPTRCIQHSDVWYNVIYTDPNVGKWVFGSYTDVWHNASNTPHNVMAISDQRPLCAIVGNCLCILNAFTHFLYLGCGLYVTIKKGCTNWEDVHVCLFSDL